MNLSIIIISYNTKELLKDCLQSIEESGKSGNPKLSIEVIVVDNHSTDGTREWLKEIKDDQFKNFSIKTIFNQENVGFAKANNQGIRESRGEYLLLLNSDTKIIEKDFFAKITKVFEENPNIGVVGPKLLWENGQIQPSGGYFPTLPRIFAWAFFLDDLPLLGKIIHSYHPHSPSFYLKNNFFKNPHQQDWVTGACFFIRKKVFNKVNLLDENIFMYTEEMELCYRIKNANYSIMYYPKAQIIHYGGKSGSSLLSIKSEFEGLKYFYQKHYSSISQFVLKILLKSAAWLRIIFFGIILNDQEKKKIYQKVAKIIS